jgi:hypothetical protein
VLQLLEEQPEQEPPLGREEGVNFQPTLVAQTLINFSACFSWQKGHSTSGSLPKTSFSKSLPQALQ